jgi:hypothetical protein
MSCFCFSRCVALYPVRFPSLRTQSERKIVLVGCFLEDRLACWFGLDCDVCFAMGFLAVTMIRHLHEAWLMMMSVTMKYIGIYS